jgi:hypothetical protein
LPLLEAVLKEAASLSREDQEFLVLQLRLSFEADGDRPSEQEFIAEMRRIAEDARANPESTMSWEEAERFIFGEQSGE